VVHAYVERLFDAEVFCRFGDTGRDESSRRVE